MKIAYGSDLHLEFSDGRPSLKSVADADVLILAGDIDVGIDKSSGCPKALLYAQTCAQELEIPVLVIAGNHEFYGREYFSYLGACRNHVAEMGNVFFLENETVQLEGVTFIGCTLWTTFSSAPHLEFALANAADSITDFRKIKYSPRGASSYRKLGPRDTKSFSFESRTFLAGALEKAATNKTVFITHFPPVFWSDPKYSGDTLSSYFCNDWDYELKTNQLSPDLWICGHTHYDADRTYGRTRIVSNQGGYPGELGTFEWKMVEL